MINKHLGWIIFSNNNIEGEAITEEEDIIKTIILRVIIKIIKSIKIMEIMAMMVVMAIMAIIIIIDNKILINNNKIHIKVDILVIMDLQQEIKIIITNQKALKVIIIKILIIEIKKI